jgi:hypothetical protein
VVPEKRAGTTKRKKTKIDSYEGFHSCFPSETRLLTESLFRRARLRPIDNNTFI